MIEVLLTAIPSLCWMLFRCYQLFKTPTSKLGSSLNLDIPHTPVPCVDYLSDSSVVLHWDIETLPDENIFYVILVNGKDAGTLAQHAVKLTSLDPDSVYRIQIVAINVISNFRSQSDAIYIRTLPDRDHRADAACLSREHIVLDDPKKSGRGLNLDITTAEAETLASKESLQNTLYALQVELGRITREHAALSTSQQKEEGTVRDEILRYKLELQEGAEARAKKELDLKQLEQKKDLLTFQKLKILKQLKSHTSQKNLSLNKLEELRLKIAKLTEKRHHVKNTANSERDKTQNNVQSLNEDIDNLKAEIQKIEESIKVANSEKKELNSTISLLKPLIEQFTTSKSLNDSRSSQDLTSSRSEPIFNLDGGLTDLGNEIIEKVYLLLPEWTQNTNLELETLHGLESSWRNTFRLSLRKYLSVYHGVESLKAAADPTYVPKRKSEYQASVEFGGQNYALPKPQNLPGDSDSSPDYNDVLADNWYDLTRSVDYESPNISTQVSVLNMHQMNDVSTGPSNSFLAQQEYPEFQPYQKDPMENRSQEAWNAYPQMPSISLPLQQPDMYPTPIAEAPLVSGPQVFGPDYSDLQSMVTGRQILANTLSPTSLKQSLLHNSQNSQARIPSDYSDHHQNYLNTDSRSAFATLLMQPTMFPYGEQVSLSSPPSEQSLLYPSNQSAHLQSTLWNNNSQSSFVDSRRPFNGLTLPKANQLSPTVSQQSNIGSERVFMSPENIYGDTRTFNDAQSINEQVHYDPQLYNDNLLFNNGGLLNNFSLPQQNSIWLDNPMAPTYSHNRTVSSGSQLWRNDGLRADKTRTSEFSPFQQDLSTEQFQERNDSSFDIRLI